MQAEETGVGPRRVKMPCVGFNPYRGHKRRTSDYVLVIAAFVVVILLVLWAALG